MFNIDPYREKTLKNILSETRMPRSLIFGTQLCLVDLYQDCSNYSPGVKIGPSPRATLYIDTYREKPLKILLFETRSSMPLI